MGSIINDVKKFFGLGLVFWVYTPAIIIREGILVN